MATARCFCCINDAPILVQNKRMKITKPARLAFVLASALGGLCVALWAALPPLLQFLAESKGSAFLGRQVHVGGIDFKPWSLELTATDVAVDTADGAAKQFAVKRVYLNLEWQSLLRLAPVVKALQLDSPAVLLTHLGAGRYDIDDLVQHLNTPPDPSGPARFAVYNIAIQGGTFNLMDRNAAMHTERKHSVRDLTLELPFISNLDAYQSIEVAPRLRFTLNDVHFDSSAHGTPFARTPQGVLALQVAGLRLDPYLPYLPAALPVKIKNGVLDADVHIDFKQPPAPAAPFVSVRGQIRLAALHLQNAQGLDLLQVGSVQVDMADVRPLERSVKLARVQVTAPVLQLARNPQGVLNWLLPKPAPATASVPSVAPDAAPWTAELAHFSVQQGAVQWLDASVRPRADVQLHDLQINAEKLQWPANAIATANGSVRISTLDKRRGVKPAPLAFKAEGTDKEATLHINLQGLSLDFAAPYLADYLEPKLAGTLDAAVDVHWNAPHWTLDVQRAAVNDFALQTPASTAPAVATKAQPASGGTQSAAQQMPSFKLLEVKDAKVDGTRQDVRIASIQLKNPSAMLNRDAQGQWAFMRWLKPRPAPTTTSNKSNPPQKPWKLALDQLQVSNGNIRLEDRSADKPVRLLVTDLQSQLKNLRWDGKNLAAQAMPLTLSASVQSGRTDPGSIDYQGSISVQPHLQVQGKFKIHELPLHAVYPYVSSQFNVDVLRADASLQGSIQWAAKPAGMELGLQADALLEDVRIKSLPAMQRGADTLGMGEELLRWKSLHVPGIDLTMAPDAPLKINIQQIIWSDFYAKLMVDKNGRTNLQDLMRAAPAEAEKMKPDAPVPVIHLGSVKLVNGKVDFTDRFVQPNYSADLSDLSGTLSQVSSVSTSGVIQMADLALRGRAEGTAQLEIIGKLNPLVKPLMLDIRGRVNDLELPPLSTYSVKYAGYGIERGKLSVDVRYNIQADGHLRATNKLVLNQLIFGDKDQSSTASLPVKLAVALLQDRNGVIDINLPISGSIDDPEFRIGPILFQVFGNLIKKAVTAPFSLLASAFSDVDDLNNDAGNIHFSAGSSTLTESSEKALSKLAVVLLQKPGLIVTVSGTAGEVAERAAMQRAQLLTLLQNHKRRRANVADSHLQSVAALPAAEYAVLLKEVYRRADMVKPRNAIGLAKDLTTAEMEELMLENIKVSPDAVRDLALERSVVVKNYLLAHQIPKERLFLGAAKTVAEDAAWIPYAEIDLSAP